MLVHKEPQLDLVGWYTLVPKSGPTHDHLLIHTLLRELYNESLVLLGFHTEDILHPNPRNPLPITIYECNPEVEDSGKEDQTEGEDKEMKDPEHTTRRSLKFRDLPFTTETGDAEMIAMQFIRQGGANATVEGSTATADASKTRLPGLRDLIGGKPATKPDSKGKQPAVAQEKGKKAEAEAKASNGASLSKEDVELISALQAKSNAIKMMRDRLQLVISYLDKLPAEPFAASQTLANAPAGQGIAPSHNILRQIQALVINLELVTPTQQDALQKEMLQQSNDVTLITMVKDLLSSVTEVREVGKKFAVVESARSQKMRRPFGDAGSQALSVGDAGDISFS
jgi:COP9 signalosome complex subunit 6